MKKFFIIIFLIINTVQAMEQQVNWSLLQKELWLEILQFHIETTQSYSEGLKRYKCILLVCKQWQQLMQTEKIQNLIKNQVYTELENYYHPLKHAVEKNILAGVYFYLKENPKKINDSIDTCDDTMLHIAASNPHNRIFDYLLAKDASVHTTNTMGKTPLHFAVCACEDDELHRLLRLQEKGANLYTKDRLGKSALEEMASMPWWCFKSLNTNAAWRLIDRLVPQEHKQALKIKSVLNYSDLRQLHERFESDKQKEKRQRTH